LINRILLFSRQKDSEHRLLNLDEVFGETLEVLTPTVPTTVIVKTEFAMHDGRVIADSTQLSQMLLNLTTNALHAMKGEGGVLTLGHRLIPAERMEPQIPESLANMSLAEITVSDTGCGMDKDTLKRLFDPFFTTKAVGQGTGLGLSVVHGIVKNHGGEIRFESEIDTGTTAFIYLPIIPEFEL